MTARPPDRSHATKQVAVRPGSQRPGLFISPRPVVGALNGGPRPAGLAKQEMTAMLSAQISPTLECPTRTLQLRQVIARSNRFMLAAVPATWIFWFALP